MDELPAPLGKDDCQPNPPPAGQASGFLAEGLSFGALLDAAPDAMVIVGASGAIQFVNRQTEAVFGFAREELIGQPIEMLVPERFRGPHGQHRARFFAHPRLRPMYAVPGLYGLRKDGCEFPAEISLSPIEGRDGLLVACAIRDVTDRVRAEELLRQRQEELAHVARLATVGELATGLAHELNQPLYSISNYAQGCLHRLRAASLEPEQLVEVLEEIALEADRAAQLIRRLRRMVQKREPVRTSIDLNQTIEEACLLSQQDLKQHAVRLVHDLDRSLPRILADEIQIQQVVVNLLRNAVEAMRETAESGGWSS